jgi:hypothetical protein
VALRVIQALGDFRKPNSVGSLMNLTFPRSLVRS